MKAYFLFLKLLIASFVVDSALVVPIWRSFVRVEAFAYGMPLLGGKQMLVISVPKHTLLNWTGEVFAYGWVPFSASGRTLVS